MDLISVFMGLDNNDTNDRAVKEEAAFSCFPVILAMITNAAKAANGDKVAVAFAKNARIVVNLRKVLESRSSFSLNPWTVAVMMFVKPSILIPCAISQRLNMELHDILVTFIDASIEAVTSTRVWMPSIHTFCECPIYFAMNKIAAVATIATNEGAKKARPSCILRRYRAIPNSTGTAQNS